MGDIRNRQSQCCQMTATPVLCPSPESYPICASSCSTEFYLLSQTELLWSNSMKPDTKSYL